MPGLWDILTNIFKPVSEVVDELHTSEEEKLTVKAKLLELQTSVVNNLILYEKSAIEAQQAVVVAEAQSESWLTRNWRPITMLSFLGIIMWNTVSGGEIAPELWNLLQLGIGGYVVGRSVEKTVSGVVGALKERDLS